MNDFYTFIILSTLNTSLSKFSNVDRFYQTLETIISIRRKIKNCKIIFIDNSILPVEEDKKSAIKNLVDLYHDYEHNLFSVYINENITQTNKGLNELLMLQCSFNKIKEHNLIGKRIFKISARYRLTDNFKIEDYNHEVFDGKYVAKQTRWLFNDGTTDHYKMFFDTCFWSFCPTLMNDVQRNIQNTFTYMLKNNENIEISYKTNFPEEKCIFVERINIDGFMTNGDYISY